MSPMPSYQLEHHGRSWLDRVASALRLHTLSELVNNNINYSRKCSGQFQIAEARPEDKDNKEINRKGYTEDGDDEWDAEIESPASSVPFL
jgi:hypothetical protein